MAEKFNSKSFNAEAFKIMSDRIPNVKKNELIKSKALKSNTEISNTFSTQNGTHYAKIAMKGLLSGDADNYDGMTDIKADTTKMYEQGIIVIGRSKAWQELDFSYDITGGVDFIQNIAEQVADYWATKEQNTILAILDGIFSMSTGSKNTEFVDYHTYDITEADNGEITSTTINSAMQLACGDNKSKFSVVFMHSAVATNLENINLIKHLTYTDKDGLTRDMTMYTWAGRVVLIDDSLYVNDDGNYVTYILGDGAFSHVDIGAKVPFEMSRDPKTSGGIDILYTRNRNVFAPYGISYEKVNQATLSPTNAELSDGDNWSLVHTGEAIETDRTYIEHKAIPIARIISKG